jgi:hypothetical protein
MHAKHILVCRWLRRQEILGGGDAVREQLVMD